LNWARAHVRDTRAQWANVLFTDKKRFRLHGNDSRTRVYRRRGERFYKPLRGRARFTRRRFINGLGWCIAPQQNRHCFRGRDLNAERYQEEILQPYVLPLARANRGFTLVYDGATCHTERTTRTFLGNNRVNTLAWPAKSPDLNVIEHVWDQLQRRVRKNGPLPVTRHELRQLIEREWNLPQAFLRNYVMSMQSRCRAVNTANGGHTRY